MNAPLSDTSLRTLHDKAQHGDASASERLIQIYEAYELWQRLLCICPPAHRLILRLKCQGCDLAEIAQRTGMHPGSVRRILYDLARRLALSGR